MGRTFWIWWGWKGNKLRYTAAAAMPSDNITCPPSDQIWVKPRPKWQIENLIERPHILGLNPRTVVSKSGFHLKFWDKLKFKVFTENWGEISQHLSLVAKCKGARVKKTAWLKVFARQLVLLVTACEVFKEAAQLEKFLEFQNYRHQHFLICHC